MKKVTNFFRIIVCSITLSVFSLVADAYYVQLDRISTRDGLNYQEVTCVTSNDNNSLWVGTSLGFNIIMNGNISSFNDATIDGVGYSIGYVNDISCYSTTRALIASGNHLFDINLNEQDFNLLSYAGNDIITKSVVILGDEAYFFDIRSNSLYSYNFELKIVSLVRQFEKSDDFNFTKLIMSPTISNRLLLIDETKGIYCINLTNDLLEKVLDIKDDIVAEATVLDVNTNSLWVANKSGGIKCYAIDSNYLIMSDFNSNNSILDAKSITDIIPLEDGTVCVGTDGDGIYYINTLTKIITNDITKDLKEVTSLCLIGEDIAIGTRYYGLVIDRRSNTHMLNEYSRNPNNNLSSDVAISAYDDGNGIIWIGTDDGGLSKYDENKDVVTKFDETNDVRIKDILRYDNNRLLVRTIHNGYLLFDKRNEKLSDTFMNTFEDLPHIINNDSVLIVPDAAGNYIIFNAGNKNFTYNPHSKKINYFDKCEKNKDGNMSLVTRYCYSENKLFFSTSESICMIEYGSLKTTHIHTLVNDKTFMTISPNGLLWFIDGEKLYKYNIETAEKPTETLNTIMGGSFVSMTSDPSGIIWLSSSDGIIYRYDQYMNQYTVYSKGYYIPEGNFLNTFALFSSNEKLYFPNASGLLLVDTKELLSKKKMVDRKVGFLYVSKDGEYMNVSKDNKVVLPNNYKVFMVQLYVNSNDPTIPIDLKLSLYRDRKYVSSYITTNTLYRNTILKRGKYDLMVQTLNQTGWSEPTKVISFKIKAPLLATAPVIFCQSLILITLVWLILYVIFRSKRRQVEQLLFEETTKNKEARISFITNVAHELRTPLSLVYNPIKDILLERTISGLDYDRMQRIFNQIHKMTNMVNMILDSSSNSDLTLTDRLEPVNLNEWIENILINFRPLCEEKGLAIKFEPCTTIEHVNIEPMVLETALSNLISNAIKYSDSGIIRVALSSSDKTIKIAVIDQGRGFTSEPEVIFKRFYREGNDDISGFGLGLSYSKKIIEQTGGTITAANNENGGSTFTIELPLNVAVDVKLSTYINDEIDYENEKEKKQEEVFDTKNKTMLFVDDDADLREYVKKEYQNIFNVVYLAKNGETALDMISEKLPDVIVSDIMMPGLNGFDLCKSIKSNLEFSHIPVILLTSRTDAQIRMVGYKLGADAFLPKPFDKQELFRIMRNQMWNRFEIKRQYSQSFFSTISEDQTFSAVDEKFVLKLNKFINENISDVNLSVEMIYEHIGVSRTTLFNKMNELLGTSAVKYIRKLRVSAAKKLLEKTDKSILDVALECGFADSQYLSAVFKQETGETPSQYRKKHKNERVVFA